MVLWLENCCTEHRRRRTALLNLDGNGLLCAIWKKKHRHAELEQRMLRKLSETKIFSVGFPRKRVAV